MHPEHLMRRALQTILGLGCVFAGCAAWVWLLSHDGRVDAVWSLLESTASAEEAPAAPPLLAEAPPAADSAIEKPAPRVTPTIDDKALINDLDITGVVDESDLAPKTRVVIPPGRPDWVEADFSHEQGDVQRVAVSSGPFFKKHEALRALDEELAKATEAFVADHLGHRAAGKLVPVDIATIRRELVRPENIYHEQIEVSLGRPFVSHALLEFSPSFKQQLDERWRSVVVAGRVARLGVIAVGVLLLLTVVLGYFKADNATRGYYTTRLQLGTAGAILALVAGGFMLFRIL